MLRFFVSITLLTSTLTASAEQLTLNAEAIDQREIHENGCGPICLLNSHRFSSAAWRSKSTDRFDTSPQEQFEYLTKRFGFKRSRYQYGHQRWNITSGMQAADLRDLANDFHKKAKLPALSHSSLFLQENETHTELIQRVHSEITTSLDNGFPPILSLSRYTKQSLRSGGHRWSKAYGHFVSIISVSKPQNSTIHFHYIDPWGGRHLDGSLTISTSTFFASDITNLKNKGLRRNPTLQANCPSTSVGAHLIKKNAPHTLSAAHLVFAKVSPAELGPPSSN